MLSDIPRALDAEVIIVVGMRLGCINHALLTARSVLSDGCRLRGWIANVLPEGMSRLGQNLSSLRNLMPCPMLGIVEGDEQSQAKVFDDMAQVLSLAAA